MMDVPTSSTQRAARRSAILAAANELFARAGYSSASVRDIALSAGVSTTLLSHHFGTKAGLLDAILGMHADRFKARARSMRTAYTSQAGHPTLGRLLEAWLAAELADAATPDGALFRRTIWQVRQDPDSEAARLARTHGAAIEDEFRSGVLACEPTATPRFADSLWAFVEGALAGHLLNRRDAPMAAATTGDPQPSDGALLVAFIVDGAQASARMFAGAKAVPPRL